MNEMLEQLKIDPEFEKVIPPLTKDEYHQLEENILDDGRIMMPIAVWGDIIVDGHNRYRIAREYGNIPFSTTQLDFANRYEAIAWICKNQFGRRKMTTKKKNNEAMPAISVRLKQDQIEECERLYKKLGLESRNDFIRDAIDFYCEYLRCPESVKFLTPALESVISGKIRDTENRLSHLQFKTAVAIEKLYLLLGDEFEKSDDDFDEYREAAVLNVKQTNGSSRY